MRASKMIKKVSLPQNQVDRKIFNIYQKLEQKERLTNQKHKYPKWIKNYKTKTLDG